MMVIGVTGGIASGKTSISRMISGRGIIHVDADKLVHRLMREDCTLINAVASTFPDCVSKPSKNVPARIDRAALAAYISAHPEALAVLEALIHPRVRAQEVAIIEAARRNRLRAVVLDIPLLFETDAQALCDVVLAAHAPRALRRQRAFARTGMTDAKWTRLLDRQLPDHVRNRAADHVIPTGIGKAVTCRQVRRLMQQWKLL